MTAPGPHDPLATTPATRRAAREAAATSPARHVRRSVAARLRAGLVLVAGAVLVLVATATVTAALGRGVPSGHRDAAATRPVGEPSPRSSPAPTAGAASVAPSASATAVTASLALCDEPAFTAALAAHDDAAAIAAAGGAESFRMAVASGAAPCVSLSDPRHVWVVVDKLRPYDPLDYAPAPLALPAGVRDLVGGELRADAAAALSTLVAAARSAGAGEIALDSGYRSYTTQQTSYGVQRAAHGTAQADLVSARPGYSEHQSGLAADLVACAGSCGTLDQLAGTPQGAWLATHAWEYGWIVRYEPGSTEVSGYLPEPWHLRYVGADLARAYHDGGWHTLEQFFGLPAAASYAG